MSTFYHGDCLFVMRHDIPPESIDLIYLDPPFFTGKKQTGRWRPDAMAISFDDSKKFWAEKGLHLTAPDWMKHLAVSQHRPDFASYLHYMLLRLRACRDVLKPTGSIYLHCDPRASHYLKMVMDEVFGSGFFVNEIIWQRTNARSNKTHWPRIHDVILLYSKSKTFTFEPETRKSGLSKLPHTLITSTGGAKYQTYELTAPGRTQKGQSGQPWQGHNPAKYERHWANNHSQMDEWDKQGLIHWPRGGGFPRRQAAEPFNPEDRRVSVSDIWNDIDRINQSAGERTGYPTQKPIALLDRIILASSGEGDVVLDPFCGCGTTAIAASRAGREWIGIDIDTSPRKPGGFPTAFNVIRNRSHLLFDQATYVSRDLDEVEEMDGHAFEKWVNEFYRATKPMPDKGIDGIAPDGMPIQSKTYEIKYPVLSQFLTDAKYHPDVPKPLKKIKAVSQTGFDNGARERRFEIKQTEKIEVELVTPKDMLSLAEATH